MVLKVADRLRPIRTLVGNLQHHRPPAPPRSPVAAMKTPSRTSSSAVCVECPFLHADWNWLKLAQLSMWGHMRANTSLSWTLDMVSQLEIGL